MLFREPALLARAWANAQRVAQVHSAVTPQHFTVGFIGLGNMGMPMALNLYKAGCDLVVFDTRIGELSLPSQRVTAASCPRQVAEHPGLSAIFTMLPATQHVQAVYEGPDGLLCASGGLGSPLLVDCSTVSPMYTRQLAALVHATPLRPDTVPLTPPAGGWHPPANPAAGAAAAVPPPAASSADSTSAADSSAPAGLSERAGAGAGAAGGGALLLDAPVSGGVPGATAASLTFMCGGSEEAMTAAKPLLNLMGKAALHCGTSGAGQAAKICNNLAMAVQMAAVSESLALGAALGLDVRQLSQVLNSSSGRCWSGDTYSPVPGVCTGTPAGRGYIGGFAAGLMVKDLRLAQEAAGSAGRNLPMGGTALQLYEQLMEEGGAPIDFSGIYKYVYCGPDPSGGQSTS